MTPFNQMPLAEELKKALSDLKFVSPTKIQKAVIPVANEGRDLIACAETGSGKTAAYGIPMVSELLAHPEKNGLVLAPTRELAHQIADFLRLLTVHCENFRVTALVGGADMGKQLRALKKKPRILVATPGRLNDHLRRRAHLVKNTHVLVLDEGDRMLDMGFAPQLDEIVKLLPKQRQTSLFTATISKRVKNLAETYLNKPESITVGRASLPAASIKQSVIQLTPNEKNERILDELNQRQGSVIVFTRTKSRTDLLTKHLKSYGYKVDGIHGGKPQGRRNRALLNFRKGDIRILCATDIAARGLDVPQVEHVINFDLPKMAEDYVHRIGRTARNGAEGEAVSFITPSDQSLWRQLAQQYQIKGVELVRFAMSDQDQSKKKSKPGRFSKKKKSSGKSAFRKDAPKRFAKKSEGTFADEDRQDRDNPFRKKRKKHASGQASSRKSHTKNETKASSSRGGKTKRGFKKTKPFSKRSGAKGRQRAFA